MQEYIDQSESMRLRTSEALHLMPSTNALFSSSSSAAVPYPSATLKRGFGNREKENIENDAQVVNRQRTTEEQVQPNVTHNHFHFNFSGANFNNNGDTTFIGGTRSITQQLGQPGTSASSQTSTTTAFHFNNEGMI